MLPNSVRVTSTSDSGLRYLNIVWNVATQSSARVLVLLRGLTHLRLGIACTFSSWHLLLHQLSDAIPRSLEKMSIQVDAVKKPLMAVW